MSEIVERFSRILRDDPHRPLLHLPSVGATLTARDLWMRAASIRDRIAGAKLHRDRPLLSLAGNRAESVALLLACRMTGNPLMPVDASTPAAEVLDFATRFSASALVRPSGGAAPAGAAVTPLCAGLELVRVPRSWRRSDLSGCRGPEADLRYHRPAESNSDLGGGARCRHVPHHRGDGHRARRYTACSHPAVARLRLREPRRHAPCPGHGNRDA